jgi:hypothetical protein
MADWRQVRDTFLRGADEYPDLCATWESRQGLWTLFEGEARGPVAPEPERLFKDTARIAVALIEKNRVGGPSWGFWLDLMREEKRGFRRILKPRTGSHYRIIMEAQNPVDFPGVPLSDSGTIPRLFKESADFCADLETHGIESKAAAPAPVAPVPSSTSPSRAGRQPDETKAAQRQKFMTPFLKKKTLSAIATHSGVLHSSLHRWYNGKSRLSVENRAKLATFLKVDLETIPN